MRALSKIGVPSLPLRRVALLGSALLVTSCLPGCYSEGGLGWSDDQFVYISRPHQPWSVSLKDTRTGQEFWNVQVPVGKQLVVHFVRNEGTKDPYTPDLMEWSIMDDGAEWERLDNRLPVPPANARRLDPVIRPSPELPPRMDLATTPRPVESGPNRR